MDKKDKEFPRGYHIEIGGGFGMPQIGTFHGACRATRDTARRSRRRSARSTARYVHFAGRGEMIPNEHSYCDIDPQAVDQWGIPVLRFHFRWSEHEIRQVNHMHETFAALIETMGGRCSGRQAAGARDRRDLGGRHHHSRSGHGAHGRRSERVGAQQILPGARREEPVRHGRRAVRRASRTRT